MATVMRVALLSTLLLGCDDLLGFSGDAPPLAEIQVDVTDDFDLVRLDQDDMSSLRATLVWGAQWLPEPLCIVPPRDDAVRSLIAAGCRDPFGFVPGRVAVDAAIERRTAVLKLTELPSADVLVGDLSARIGYASFVVYADRDGDHRLQLDRARRPPQPGDGPDDDGPITEDRVYGASFVRMTEPDQRLAFREGGFDARAAFYPRRGCGEPPPGFSLLSAGGFSAAAALEALGAGELPQQDPTRCRQRGTDAPVTIALRAPGELRDVACEVRRTDSSVRYREPPARMPDLAERVAACAPIPDFGSGEARGITQFVVSGRADESCAGLTHYLLRGCGEDPLCSTPEWDVTDNPPPWWTCPGPGAP